MKLVLFASALLTACTVATEPDLIEPPEGPYAGNTAQLALCASGDGVLQAAWSVDNRHGAVSALSVGPTGSAALAGADGTIKLWDINSGELGWNSDEVEDPGAAYGSEMSTEGPLTALAFDDTGEFIAGGDALGNVMVWSAGTGFSAAGWAAGEAPITSVAQGFDGQLIAAATSAFGGELRAWTLNGAPAGDPLETQLWFVNALRLEENDFVVAGDIYGEPAVELRSAAFTTATMGVATARGLSGTARDVANLGDGRVLLGGAGFLVVLDVYADQADQTVVSAEGFDTYVSVVALDDDHFAAATEDGRVQVGTLSDLAVQAELASSPMTALKAVSGGWQLAATGEDGVLRLIGCGG